MAARKKPGRIKQKGAKGVQPVVVGNTALRGRQADFVLHYVSNGFRQQEAAIAAGFSPRSAHVQANRLLKNDNIKTAIEALIKDKVMAADEALYRLSMHARADLRPFLGLSVEEIKKHPDAWLIKKLKSQTIRRAGGESGDEVIEERVEIEVHDPQTALGMIGKHLHLFVDRVEHTGAAGGPIEIRRATELSDDELAAIIQAKP